MATWDRDLDLDFYRIYVNNYSPGKIHFYKHSVMNELLKLLYIIKTRIPLHASFVPIKESSSSLIKENSISILKHLNKQYNNFILTGNPGTGLLHFIMIQFVIRYFIYQCFNFLVNRHVMTMNILLQVGRDHSRTM